MEPEYEALGVLLGGLAGFLAFGAVIGVLTWLVRAVIQHRRWIKASTVQADVHSKLMDRMTTNEELLAYIQSPTGRRFLEAAPIRAGVDAPTISAPVGPIIWSMMAGIVLATVGFGFRRCRRQHHRRSRSARSRWSAIILLALGVGLPDRVVDGVRRVVAARPVPARAPRARIRPMRELTLTDMERLGAFDEAERTFQMTEEAFRTFYELTARPVRVYLARMTGDDRLADDLLQETYYRFLRSNVVVRERRPSPPLPVSHRHQPGARPSPPAARRSAVDDAAEPRPTLHASRNVAERAARRIDLQRAMARLKPRERSMLWLAYALGWSHEEIAASIGVKTGSLKPMLHRARQRLAGLLNFDSQQPGRWAGCHSPGQGRS